MGSRKRSKNIFSSKRLNSAKLRPIATFSCVYLQCVPAQPKPKDGLPLRLWMQRLTVASLARCAATRSTRSIGGTCTRTRSWRKAVFTRPVKSRDLYTRMTTKAPLVKALHQSRQEGRVKYMALNVSFTNHLPQPFKHVNSARSFWLVRLALTNWMS